MAVVNDDGEVAVREQQAEDDVRANVSEAAGNEDALMGELERLTDAANLALSDGHCGGVVCCCKIQKKWRDKQCSVYSFFGLCVENWQEKRLADWWWPGGVGRSIGFRRLSPFVSEQSLEQ